MKYCFHTPPVLVLILMSITTGCAQYGEVNRTDVDQVASYASLQTWVKAAAAYEKEGDLARALVQYRIARVVSPGDRLIKGEIKRLESEIDVRTMQYAKQGDAALKNGKIRRAKQAYLQVLSLDPDHDDALRALRSIQEADARRSIARKARLSQETHDRHQQPKNLKGYEEETFAYSRQSLLQKQGRPDKVGEYIKELEKHLEKYPRDRKIRHLLVETMMSLAEHAYKKQNLDQTLDYLNKSVMAAAGDSAELKTIAAARKGYGKGLYILGLRVYRDNLPQAVRHWEYALKFDPEDERLRLRLQNATNR